MFLLRNKKISLNYRKYPLLSGALLHVYLSFIVLRLMGILSEEVTSNFASFLSTFVSVS